jgi:Fe2+ transport system protein B
MANSAFGVKSIAELPLTPEQAIVFVIFVTLYFPCFSTFVVMWKEFGKKIVFLSSVISLIVALAAAFVMKLILF